MDQLRSALFVCALTALGACDAERILAFANSGDAGESNVTFDGAAWTHDISHGEAIRAGYDETLALDPCNLRYVFQGADPTADNMGDYNKIPWRIGLLTQVE